MPSSRSSLAAWNTSGAKAIFCASNLASLSDIGSAKSVFMAGIVFLWQHVALIGTAVGATPWRQNPSRTPSCTVRGGPARPTGWPNVREAMRPSTGPPLKRSSRFTICR